MPVAINQPQKRDDPLDKVLKGLQIATSVYGLSVDMEKAKTMRSQLEADKSTRATDAELKGLQIKDLKSKQGLAAAENDSSSPLARSMQEFLKSKGVPITGQETPGFINKNYGAYFKPPPAKDPLAQELARGRVDEQKARKDQREKELRDGQKLPAALVDRLNDGAVAEQQANALESIIGRAGDKAFGPFVGRVRSINPYDETSQKLVAELKTAKQAIGKFLEGGVLRKEDESKYDMILPQPADTPEVARQKAANVRNLINAKKQANLESFRAQGYNISGLDQGGQSMAAQKRDDTAAPSVGAKAKAKSPPFGFDQSTEAKIQNAMKASGLPRKEVLELLRKEGRLK
jgi:hypothetical protein